MTRDIDRRTGTFESVTHVPDEGAPPGRFLSALSRRPWTPEGWVPFPTVWDPADVQHPFFLTRLGVTDGSVPPLSLSGKEVFFKKRCLRGKPGGADEPGIRLYVTRRS